MRIADHIHKYFIEHDIEIVMWGDGCLVDASRKHVKLKNMHPLNVMDAAINAMDRAPDLFEKSYVRGHDSQSRQRVVRSFKVKTTADGCLNTKGE